MPNLVICLRFVRFVLFGPRDPPTNSVKIQNTIEINDDLRSNTQAGQRQFDNLPFWITTIQYNYE